MLTLTEGARAQYEEYLRRVRACIAAAGQASPAEVIADIEEHVSRELEDAAEPVSGEAVRQVLGRLGEPEQWIALEELPWWRRVALRVRTGPEDWRLAYAAFGLLFVGVLFGWIFSGTHTWEYPMDSPGLTPMVTPSGTAGSSHEFNLTALAIFWVVSFIVARAAVAAATDRSHLSSGQKWLVYPSLVVPYGFAAIAVLIGLPCLVGAGGFMLSEESLKAGGLQTSVVDYPLPRSWGINAYEARAGIFGAYVGVITAGLWWITLGVLLLFRRPRQVAQILFAPFLRNISRKLCVTAIVAGSFLLVLAAAATVVAHAQNHRYF